MGKRWDYAGRGETGERTRQVGSGSGPSPVHADEHLQEQFKTSAMSSFLVSFNMNLKVYSVRAGSVPTFR